ncbi:heterokaryon incompatibility protein-domain-containing protein [Nemania serpens]|nr:heterokaryon incompatibility protein-domain-containing protein [Nemania serpens]
MSPDFTYPPLVEHDHIRIILLQPAAARNDVLVGSFQLISLNNHYYDLIEPYTALSYVWGQLTSADTILIDGQELGITANLGAALRDLRDGDRSHRIWADALCIDQRNIPERSQQVALMGQIYSRANNTVIHLGPLTPHAEIIVREVHRAVLLGPNAENSPGDEGVIITAAKEGLLAQPWFHRAWVLQELVLSREPWAQFGSKRIRWQDMCHLLIRVLRQGRPAEDTGTDVTALESMHRIRSDYWKDYVSSLFTDMSPKKGVDSSSNKDKGDGDPRRLWRLLDTRRNCGVTDPRDMVFAHLGIISDREEALKYIKIDYSQTTSELFIAVGRYAHRCAGLLAFLDALRPSCTADLVLPSWVPDWNRRVCREASDPELEKSLSNPFLTSCRAEAFPSAYAVEIVSVSGILPPLSPSFLRDFRRIFYDFDSAWRSHPDDSLWKDVVDSLAVIGVKSSDFHGIPFESWPHCLGSKEREIFDHQVRKFLDIGQWRHTVGPRLALLSNGRIIDAPRETSCGDVIVRLAPFKEMQYEVFERSISQVSWHENTLVVVQRNTPPGAESWEQAFVSNYVAAVFQRDDDIRSSGADKYSFLHGRLVGVCPITTRSPVGLNIQWPLKEEKMTGWVSGWSTHDVAQRLGRQRNSDPTSHTIASLVVLH